MPSAFFNWPLEALRYKRCTGAVPGKVFTAPGRVIAVAYNGVFLRPNLTAPKQSCMIVAQAVTLTFEVQEGDRIDALCISI